MSLTLENIGCTLGGSKILEGISLEVKDGEFVSLLGASGAGKSTTLKIIAGLLLQTEGHVYIDGMLADNLASHKRGTSIVFQDIRLFPNMNVEENVAFALRMKGARRAERLARANELLGMVHLPGYGARRVNELSGGQQQRVALARALAADPAIVLLDEPFSGLDEELREDMRELVVKLQRETGTTTVQVTHDASEALMMSDRIAYLANGTIIQYGTPQELYEHPRTIEVATCTGDCATLEGTVEANVFRAGNLELPCRCEDGPASAVLRYGHLALAAGDALTVLETQYRGDCHIVKAKVGDQAIALPAVRAWAPGTRLDLHVDGDGCFVFSTADAAIPPSASEAAGSSQA